MPIEIQCSSCGTKYRVGEDKAGKRMRCKNCQEVIEVPAADSRDDVFNVFDSAPAEQFRKGKRQRPASDDPFADPFASTDDPFAKDPFADSFDMEAAFKEAPTMPPAGGAPRKRSRPAPPPPSSGPDVMVYVGIGALVLIAIAVGAFLYFAGDRDNDGEVAANDDDGDDNRDNGDEVGDGDHDEVGDGEADTNDQPRRAGTISVLRAQVGFGDLGPNASIRNESGRYSGTDITYTFEGQAGQRASLALVSEDFDAMLTLLTPVGKSYANDDLNGTSSSMIQLALPESGTYAVTVSAFEGQGTGNFELEIALSAGAMAQVEVGNLMAGDPQGPGGSHEDSFTFQGRRGSRVRLQLSSHAFDPLVRLIGPSGSVMENDDRLPLETDSWLTTALAADGEYRVVVTSFEPNQQGDYILVMDQSAPCQRQVNGDLNFGDEQLESGEYVDTTTFHGTAGQKVNIAAFSTDFDTYLILIPPQHDQYDNDDLINSNAELSLTLPDTGEYEVLVTTYEPNETGNYVLTMDFE